MCSRPRRVPRQRNLTDLSASDHVVMLEPRFPDGNRALEPPDPFPNSEVKRRIADDSVRPPHAKVGHRQGFILLSESRGFAVAVATAIEKRWLAIAFFLAGGICGWLRTRRSSESARCTVRPWQDSRQYGT